MKSSVVAIEKEKNEKKVIEGQCVVLKSEKAALSKSLEKAKASRDKAITLAVSL